MCRMSRAEQGSMARGKGRAQQSSTHAHERRMRARAHATHARARMQHKQGGALLISRRVGGQRLPSMREGGGK